MDPQPKRILLVEDEKFIADLYARQLTNSGFAVTTAYDGISAQKFLQTEKYDLLLLDIMLPGINGLELLKDLRQKNPQATMPVLLLTNLGQEAVIKEGFTLGAAGYLIKASYTPAQIVAEVHNALAGKQAGSPNPNLNLPPAPTPMPQTPKPPEPVVQTSFTNLSPSTPTAAPPQAPTDKS